MSIDRRSFVQSVTVALGGAATLSADAAAQGRVQLTASYPTTPINGPYKPTYYNVGDQAQRYYSFLKELFDPNKSLRKDIWGMSDDQLRKELKARLGFDLTDPNIKIMIVDIENGRAKFSDGIDCSSVTGCAVGDPKNTAWYTLVLPPRPLGYKRTDGTPQTGYLEEMTWESAWHHAVVYGYGM